MNRFMYILAFVGLVFSSPILAQDAEPVAEEVTSEEVASEEGTSEDGDEAAPEEEIASEEEGVSEGGEEITAEGTPEEAEELVDEIESIEEAAEEAFALIDAVKSKNWPLVVGLALTLLVFVANKLGLRNRVGPKLVPWVAMILAVAATVGTGLTVGLGWTESLIQGILTGVAAIGGWELLLRHVLTGKDLSEVPIE